MSAVVDYPDCVYCGKKVCAILKYGDAFIFWCEHCQQSVEVRYEELLRDSRRS